MFEICATHMKAEIIHPIYNQAAARAAYENMRMDYNYNMVGLRDLFLAAVRIRY